MKGVLRGFYGKSKFCQCLCSSQDIVYKEKTFPQGVLPSQVTLSIFINSADVLPLYSVGYF